MATRRSVHGFHDRPCYDGRQHLITEMQERVRPPFAGGVNLEVTDMPGVSRLAHSSRLGPAVQPNAPQCGTVGPLVGLIGLSRFAISAISRMVVALAGQASH